MSQGRRATAPCGHEGEVVIGTYVQCRTCDCSDAIPAPIEEDERTRPLCKACGSKDTEPFATDAFLNCWHCIPCGHVQWT